MKLNRFTWLVVLAGVLAAGFFAPSGVATSSAVQVPEALRLAIGGLTLMLVTLGLQAVFDGIGLDLRGAGAIVAVSLSGFVIAQLQGLINVIPAAYDQMTMIVLNILVVILSGLGSIRALVQPERASRLFQA